MSCILMPILETDNGDVDDMAKNIGDGNVGNNLTSSETTNNRLRDIVDDMYRLKYI